MARGGQDGGMGGKEKRARSGESQLAAIIQSPPHAELLISPFLYVLSIVVYNYFRRQGVEMLRS